MSRVLRQRPRVCYYEPEEPSFDEYIFCSSCGDFVYEYCSIHGPLLVVPDDKVRSPSGFPPFVPRAALTIPHVFLHLAPSTIPDAGIGVFSTLTLPRGVRFGPYAGVKTDNPAPGYSWQIYDRNHKRPHAVDARDADRSNWMRYVNCSRHWAEQNLVAFQYQGQLYYRTVKIIPSCTELLVFYGSEFALSLGVDLGWYHSPEGYSQLRLADSALKCEVKPCISIASENDVKNPTNSGVTKNVAENFDLIQNDQESHVSSSANDFDDAQEEKSITNENNNATENNAYICNDGNAFNEKSQSVPHIATHNTMKESIKTNVNTNRSLKFACLCCDSKFATKSDLINHDIKVHGSKVNYKACDSCDYKTLKNYKLKMHMWTHSELSIKCDVCDAKFTTNNNLKVHSRIHTGLKPYQCAVCESKYTYNSSLKRQRDTLRVHSGVKPFPCNVCDATFIDSGGLTIHLRSHTGEKPYNCTICDSKFKQSSALTSHSRVHTGEKLFSCSICGSKFSMGSSLKDHMRIHTGEKPYKCMVCESKFRNNSALKKHLRIHTGEKPHKCTVCESKFRDNSALKRHLRIHTGEKPYKCTVCESKFRDNSTLKRHFRIHTGEKPYKCTVCSSKFTESGTLRKHEKIHKGK